VFCVILYKNILFTSLSHKHLNNETLCGARLMGSSDLTLTKINHDIIISWTRRTKSQICFLRVAAIAAAVIAENSAVADHQGASMSALLHQHVKRFSGLYTGPYFDTSIATNITAQLGTHAFLPCKVKQLGNKSVSTVANTSLLQQQVFQSAGSSKSYVIFLLVIGPGKSISLSRKTQCEVFILRLISGDELSWSFIC